MIERRRFVAAWPLAVLLAGGAFAPAVRAAALAQLRTFLAETRTARGEFTQKVMRVDGGVAESSSGDFAFARPGRFRWEVRKPFEQLLVADGERLWFYDQDLNQVTVRPMSDSLVSTPAAILFGDADLERDFALRELAPRDGLEWVEALPRSKEAGFERITLGMRDGLPVTMQVADAFGRTTVFGFHAIVRNAAPAPELFRYVPPKGVDVVGQ
ncbi:MAG: outer membrane lipoprotein chaperone LolA [Burkholderiaceae bacterium]|nr:outer membrane lipoprotein chaperone LolA [Burkholderiaceae bacterium]MEB2351088.1 outer membrane lipoprotein chaperone LolA [Burkholderiaceae bacterium]